MQNLRDGMKICGTRGCRHFGRSLEKYVDPSGIELDTCRGCGCVVFDAGEVQELIRYTQEMARVRSTGGYVQPYRQPTEVIVVERDDDYFYGDRDFALFPDIF